MKFQIIAPALAVSVCVASSTLHADIVDSFQFGEGDSSSSILFQFTNGNQYLYEVSYSSDDFTGLDAIQLIADESEELLFEYSVTSYSFGDALTSVAIGDDGDSGFGSPPDYLDYWHYWVRDDAGSEWGFSSVGFSDRVLSDGSWDGWVFNSNDVPIPVTGTIFGLAGLSAYRRRRG